MALELLINAQDALDFVQANSMNVKNSGYKQTGVLSFALLGSPYYPGAGAYDFAIQPEDSVFLADGSTRYYAGIVRNIRRTNLQVGTVLVNVDCQDVSTLPNDDICDVDAARDFVFETDAERIDWLFTTFGTKGVIIDTEVQSLRATMPFMDFTGKSLAEALDMICALTGGSWYVDYDLHLHYFATESEIAPYAFSDTPDDVTTVAYRGLEVPDESTGLKNAVYVIGGIPAGDIVPLAQWYEDAASIAIYGRREASIRDDRVTDQDTLDSYGASFLAANAAPHRTGSLTTFTPGFRAGMTTYLTNADYGMSADEYRITGVTTSFPNNSPEYVIEFGDPKLTLQGYIKGTSSSAAAAAVATTPDTVAPSVPQGVSAIGGFRGAALHWLPVGGADLMFYQLQYGLNGVDFSLAQINVKSSTIWVPDLTPDVTYQFRVRAVDLSGNVATSGSDATAVSYLTEPEAGWSSTVTALPTQVGSADIAANTITSSMIATAGLIADVIKAGTLTLTPSGSDITGPVALEIRDSDGILQGTWVPDEGVTIYGTDPSDYAQFNEGYLRFYNNGILQAEIGPDGILADSIRVGALSGGHNLILNSSFELAAFGAVATSYTFTDNSGTPGWKAANRTTAIDNITESTSLSPTTVAY